MTKKWITETEIKQILDVYSVRKNEFTKFQGFSYCYVSRLVKGYMLAINQESDGFENTGRIIVTHSQDDGKKSFQDVWQRGQDGDYQFIFRNPWNLPLSDAEYIKDLEQQVEILKLAEKRAQKHLQQYHELINDTEKGQQIESLQKEVEALKQEKDALKQQNQELKNRTRHNARGAGRKPSPERLDKISQVKELLEEGFYSDAQIIEMLGISRSTFFRYKKECQEKLKGKISAPPGWTL